MRARIVAWLYLAVAFWVNVLLLRPWRRRRGLNQFRRNYRPDRLRPLSLRQRRRLFLHSRCIQCGLCLEAFESIIPVAATIRWSRSGHDAWAARAEAEELASSPALEAAEAICPTRVPLGDVGQYILRAAENIEYVAGDDRSARG